MSGLEKIILSSLNAASYEIEESKKSKGKSVLINKIKVFKEYIQNVYTYKVKNGVEKLSDERLSSYIEYLNKENITVDKAIDEIHNYADNLLENTIGPVSMDKIDNAQTKLDKLNDKKRDIEKELEEAESEKLAREAFVAMDQDSEIELNETDAVTLEPINEEISADMEVDEFAKQIENKVIQSNEPIEETYVFSEPIPEDAQPIAEEQQAIETEVEVEVETDDKGEEQQEVEVEKTVENTIQDEYIEAIDKIETDFRERFGRDFAGIVNAIMEETEKYANRQVTEITEVSKKAIDTANNNTQKVLEEKAVVENDRDQYKTRYEQTVNVVNEKTEVINAKDAEIEALKQEITKRDEIIAEKDRNIDELNNTLVEKEGQITNLEIDNKKYEITISTIFKNNYTQSEMVEEEVKTK